MIDDAPMTGRATINDVFRIVGELRAEIRKDMCDARDETRSGLEAIADKLDQAVTAIRDGFVPVGEYRATLEAQSAALTAASQISSDDRDRLWERARELEQTTKDDVASALKAAAEAAKVAQDALGRVLLIAGGIGAVSMMISIAGVLIAAYRATH